MNIVCTIDNNYIRHCAVMLRTLRDENPDAPINLTIVHDALEPTERARLARYLGAFLPSVSFIQINPELLEGFPVYGHVTVATYFRLLLPAILPWGMQKVIFMDCDMIVTDSLGPLWDFPLEGRPLAAVTDRSQEENCQRVGLGEGHRYFNAGVLLIDLEQWRRQDVLGRGLAFAAANPHRIEYWDQDVLNHLFEGQWRPIDPKWNALPHIWGLNPQIGDDLSALDEQERAAREHPAVVHFAGAGRTKPWNHHCRHPWKTRYREVQRRTPWSSVPLEDSPPPVLVRLSRDALFRAKCMAKTVLSGRPRPS